MSKRTRLLSKLKHVYSHNAKLVLDVSNDDIGLIIEGVEKQIRKKVTGFWYFPKCSVCNGMAGEGLRKFNYCPNCGQKLLWEGNVDGNNSEN